MSKQQRYEKMIIRTINKKGEYIIDEDDDRYDDVIERLMDKGIIELNNEDTSVINKGPSFPDKASREVTK